MSLTGLNFFLFLFITLTLYYVLPGKLQKYVLLGAGMYFYFGVITIEPYKVALVLTYIVVITYLGALWIERSKGKAKTGVAILVIGALVGALFVLKYAYNMVTLLLALFRFDGSITWLQFASLMGISYFVLSAIGYLMDVYWESYKAERNFFVVAVFILYFPQMISGPITRFPQMKEQFTTTHRPAYEDVSGGMRRMAWGYFKKLVISERFAVVVSTVFGAYSEYSGFLLVVAALCYLIRLYTDFSGCMDIIMGASQMFGIHLPENFNAPFLSRSIKEFWQRWHITLGSWFKDYVMYPVQISKPFISLGKKAKKLFGKKHGKKVPTYLSMFILWFLLGVWHGGTVQYFVASALIPFVLLIGGDLLEPVWTKLMKKWSVHTEGFVFRLIQRIRTMLLLCLCWFFVCTPTVKNGLEALKQVCIHFVWRDSHSISLESMGLGYADLILMILGVVLILFEHACLGCDTNMKKVMDKQKWPVKYAAIYAELLLILFFGMVGNSTFIYFKF